MAPEILKGEEAYNYKVDLWSIGVILYKLYFGVFPYNGPSEMAIIEKIEQSGKEALKKTDNKDLDDLIMNLLEKDPSKRFTWYQYFNHSFFNDKNVSFSKPETNSSTESFLTIDALRTSILIIL